MNKIIIILSVIMLSWALMLKGEDNHSKDQKIEFSFEYPENKVTKGRELDLKLIIKTGTNIKITYLIDNNFITIKDKKSGEIDAVNGDNYIRIKGINIGESKITISYKSDPTQTCSCKCKVVEEPPITISRITIKPQKTIKIGENITLTAVIAFSNNNTSSDVTWNSSNNEIATIDKNSGKITAIEEGETDITAASKDGSQSDTVKLKVEKEKSNYLCLIIFLGIVLVSGIVFFYITVKQIRAKLGKIKKEFEDLKKQISVNCQAEKAALENAKTELDEKYKEKINGLEQKVKDFEEKYNDKFNPKRKDKLDRKNDVDIANSDKDTKPNNLRYADAINNGEFYNVTEQPGDLSVFELELTNNTTATFKVYSEAEKRVVARPGNLEGCETDIVQGGKSLETITIGKAHEASGKWIVDSALKVKIV